MSIIRSKQISGCDSGEIDHSYVLRINYKNHLSLCKKKEKYIRVLFPVWRFLYNFRLSGSCNSINGVLVIIHLVEYYR